MKGNRDCNRCGTNHAPQKNPAYSKDCRKCGGKIILQDSASLKKVWVVERGKYTNDSKGEDEQFFMEAVLEEASTKDEWIAHLDVNRVTVPLN